MCLNHEVLFSMLSITIIIESYIINVYYIIQICLK